MSGRRIQVNLEEPLYREVAAKAKIEKISLSLAVRDLVKRCLEIEEDFIFSELATERLKTFKPEDALTLAQLKRKLRL